MTTNEQAAAQLLAAFQAAAYWPALPARLRNAIIAECQYHANSHGLLPEDSSASALYHWCDSLNAARLPDVGIKTLRDTREILINLGIAASTPPAIAADDSDVPLPAIDTAYLDVQIAANRSNSRR